MQGLGFLLHNAASLLKREFERTARPYGLTLLQWRVLGVLALEDGQTQTALAGRLDASPMTISDVLERLETAGFVSREVDPQDSRAKLVRITSAGQGIVAEMRTAAAGVYERAVEGIGEADRAAMLRALSRIATNLDDINIKTKDSVS